MRIVAVSDTHNDSYLYKKIQKLSGDFLFICGDLTNTGESKDLIKYLKYVDKSNFKHKVVILGNHELKNGYEFCRENFKNIMFLDNEVAEIDGVKIYGTPYCNEFGGWNFQYNSIDDCIRKTIPREEVDIILSHEPPKSNNLSLLKWQGEIIDIGNNELTKYLNNCEREMLLFCGHVHEEGGGKAVIGNTTCYNVANHIVIIDKE